MSGNSSQIEISVFVIENIVAVKILTRKMQVKSIPIIPIKGFRHESSSISEIVGSFLGDIIKKDRSVGTIQRGGRFEVYFMLGWSDFVMSFFKCNSAVF